MDHITPNQKPPTNYERNKELARQRYQRNREQISEQGKVKNRQLRLEMIAAYGGRCECCGISQWQFLNIDHINGGGKKHQQEPGGPAGIVRYLKINGWPKDDFRLLCWNCNCARFRHGVCPHQQSLLPGEPENIVVRRTHKRCPRCGEEKLIDMDFFKTKRGNVGPYCKPCSLEYRTERRHLYNNGMILPNGDTGMGILKRCPKCDLWKESNNGFYRSQGWCISCTKDRGIQTANRRRETNRNRNRLIRLNAIAAYGSVCVCCGEADWRFLTFDHINGGGTRKRSEGERPGGGFCFFLQKKGYPKDYCQLLCYNCNCAKGCYGICPHRLPLDRELAYPTN